MFSYVETEAGMESQTKEGGVFQMRTATIGLIFLCCLPSSVLFAQCRECMPATLFSWDGSPEAFGEMTPIATDRPDFTEASSAVGLGVAQLEMGYTFAKSTGTQDHSWGEPLLRVGVLANWLELRLGFAPVSQRTIDSVSGTEDLYLGAKLGLTRQDGFLPEIALVPQMTVPTGSSEFTSDRVLPGANLLYGWDITDIWSFAGSTQYNRSVDDLGSSYDEWAQSLTIGRGLTDQVGSYFEWFALVPEEAASVATEHYINGGLTYGWTDDVQMDVRIGKGLSDAADDYFVGAGLSLRYY
jgi:Putative MetA-pathway of phenol degradation